MGLSRGAFPLGASGKMDSKESYSRGIVKEDLIALDFPDGGKLDRARSVDAKEHSTDGASPGQNSLSQRKRAGLEMEVLADGLIDVIAQIFKRTNFWRTGVAGCHRSDLSLWASRRQRNLSSAGQEREVNPHNADTGNIGREDGNSSFQNPDHLGGSKRLR